MPETNTHHPLSIKDNKQGIKKREQRTEPHGERMKKIEVCMINVEYSNDTIITLGAAFGDASTTFDAFLFMKVT